MPLAAVGLGMIIHYSKTDCGILLIFLYQAFYFNIIFSMDKFKLKFPFQPTGDQPAAIEKLITGLKKGFKHQTLLGATGTGKTFSILKDYPDAFMPKFLYKMDSTKKLLLILNS